jgi:hypothetical protein
MGERTGPATSEQAWLRRLAGARAEWESQRVLMETHIAALSSALPQKESAASRALLAALTAQGDATRSLFAARASSAEALLLMDDAAEGFADLDRSAAPRDLAARHAKVAATLLDAQTEAAEILLASQTRISEALRSDQAAEADTLRRSQEERE